MAIEALSYPIGYVDSNIVEETEFYNPLVPNYGTGTYRTELDIYKIESEDIPSNIIDIIGTGSNINQNSKYYNYSFIENGILISHTGVASLGDLNNYALTSYTPNIKGVTLVTLVFSNGISHSNGEYYTYDIQVKVIYQEDGVHQQVLHTSTNNYTIYDGLTNHAGITPELFFDNGALYSFNPI